MHCLWRKPENLFNINAVRQDIMPVFPCQRDILAITGHFFVQSHRKDCALNRQLTAKTDYYL